MMTILRDPEGTEIAALRDLVDVNGERVLEIGCGDGRLTWRYAAKAAHVTAFDPDADAIARAMENRPPELCERVEFLVSSLNDFTPPETSLKFDIAILSWSL